MISDIDIVYIIIVCVSILYILGSLSRWRGLFLLWSIVAVVNIVADVVVVAVLVRFLKTC